MTAPALQLDFRQPPRSRWRGVGWLGLVAAVIGVVVVSESHSEAVAAHEQAQRRHALLAVRVTERSPLRSVAAPDAQTLSDIGRANAVIDRLTVPWDALFDAIEGADARQLGLLSLAPNASDRSLRLAGEVRSMDELLAYVERLAAQATMTQVHLQGYRRTQRDGVSVVSFTLAATWQQP